VAITPEQIDLWIGLPSETQRLEFKEAKNQYDHNKLFGYCIGIANEGGGHLILGVTNSKPRRVVGSNAFPDVNGTAEKIFRSLGFRVDVEAVQHRHGRVVVFQIPSRPRGTAYHLEGKYLMRSGESLVPMSEDQLRKIFKEGEPDWLEEHTITGVNQADVIELLDVRSFFTLLKLPQPDNARGIVSRLAQERLIDKVNGSGYAIRRLGALLLARQLSVFPDLARRAARIIAYRDTSKIETEVDVSAKAGYAVGFQALVKYISGRLPQNEVIKDALRTEVKWIPEVTIRELVANALIHQDFGITGTSVMIEIYSNRLEISSPGNPMVPIERFIDGYQSRNERLADVMRRLRICEEKSSGVDKVVRAAEMYQLPAPDFRRGHNRTIAIIYGPKQFDEMDRDDRIRACYQHCALRHVMCERMTNQTLRKRFRLPEAKSAIVSQVISMTMDAGLVRADESVGGSRKFARYVPFWA
jgi:ATP-dependent DNA helicase RecG